MKRLYYSIGDVSEITSVEPHVLRYWESIFKELSPKKNSGGNRVYKENDIEVILKLKSLIKEKKFSTKGAQQALEMEQHSQDGQMEVPVSLKRDLQEIRLFLNKILVKL